MNDKYRYWFWVLYPVGLILMMFISARIMFSANANKFVEANIKRKQVETESVKVANLKAKLNYLNSIDQAQYITDIKFLTSVIPASKKPWLTLAEMNLAASRSGISVADFFGTIGDIKEASEAATGAIPELYIESQVKVSDFQMLRKFYDELAKFRPLVKVLSLDWDAQSVEMNIDVSYAPWPKLVADPEGVVSENKEARMALMEKLQGFEDIDPLVEYAASGSGNLGEEVSPF